MGGKIAVAESIRNLAMTGASPIGLTDNLNFGNPYNPEIFWQLQQSVDGLAEACRFFDVPVTGGNVSLYNQSPQGAIDPTPTVGTVGLIPNEKMITTSFFKQMNDVIILLGGWGWEIAGTSYCQEIHGLKCGMPPFIDLEAEKRLHDGVRALIAAGLCRSAHDLSDGGLGVALAESIIGSPVGLGASIEITNDQRFDVTLFNESQSRAIVSVRPSTAKEALDLLEKHSVPAQIIGSVSFKPELIFAFGKQKITWTRQDLHSAYEGTIPNLMGPS